jgi:hypothetical protein
MTNPIMPKLHPIVKGRLLKAKHGQTLKMDLMATLIKMDLPTLKKRHLVQTQKSQIPMMMV